METNNSQQRGLLVILDGYGLGDHKADDAIFNTPTPYMDSLMASWPHSQLQACGEDVGLPDGQMGNSEVGHLNIGAGRIVYQDLVKINRAIASGEIRQMKAIREAYEYCCATGHALHLMGLCSDGGVHSSLDHLMVLLDIAADYGLERVYVHCFMDGRDTDPRSGAGFVKQVAGHCQRTTGAVATVIGRFYAMDRDKRWERISVAYDMLVNGVGRLAVDPVKAIEESYAEGVTDEFIEPIVNTTVPGRICEEDCVIFFNYRNDRAKEITTVLTQHAEDGMHPVGGLQYYCMTPYDDSFRGVHIIFDKENVSNTLAEYLSACGKTQLHIAETEKYAHVTFFLNGGREEPFAGEDRILVPSPKVATYDLQPEMSAPQVTEKLTAAITTERYDFIVVNFANGDMVGHTGVYEAIQRAVATVDECVAKVVEAAKAHGYATIVIADHGNADHATNADGSPNTAHSLNPVPFIYINPAAPVATVSDGRLADVAPTMLHVMGLPIPAEMTGKVLV